jgi:hypothetical protein
VAAGVIALILRAIRVREVTRQYCQADFTGKDLP